MKSQKKNHVWLVNDLTYEAMQQKLDQLILYLGRFRRLTEISNLHFSEAVGIHKSCLNVLRPRTQVGSIMKYFFSVIEMNDMHLHTSHILMLLWKCRMENKELIIKEVEPGQQLKENEYLLLEQKKKKKK